MTTRKQSSCFRDVIIIFVVFLGLCVAAGLWAFDAIPRRAAREFGQPAQGFDRVQAFVYSVQLLNVRSKLLEPVNVNGRPQVFRITVDQPVDSIALNLEYAGLIRSASAFRLYLVYSGLDRSIQAGEYRLSPSLSSIEVARSIQDASPSEVSLLIFPGWRMEEIAAALPTSGISVAPQQFLAEVRKPSAGIIPQSLLVLSNYEGFLFADAYVFNRTVTASEMVAAMLARFDEKVTADMRSGFTRQGLDLKQAVILASIVEREAIKSDEQAMIASVFYNRLKKNMKLESDPTVQYALGFNPVQDSWWTNPLSAADLKIDSPYNTYLFPGLPPTAISNPGIDAIRAVAYPAQTSYLYFRARCDGSGYHNFATTFQEHVRNGCP